MTATHQRRAGGGAGRADVEIAETGGLGVEAVNMGGFQVRVTHAGEVTHALVIGEHENNIGFLTRKPALLYNACAPFGHPLLVFIRFGCGSGIPGLAGEGDEAQWQQEAANVFGCLFHVFKSLKVMEPLAPASSVAARLFLVLCSWFLVGRFAADA